MTESTKARARIGVRVTLIGQFLKFSLQASSIAILSRIVSQNDFGVYTVVASLTALAVLVGDFGLSYAAVQAKHLTNDQRSNLFWINCALGIALTVLFFTAAPVLAHLYEMPSLELALKVASISFFLLALGVQLKANLMREMRFSTLALSDILSQLLGLAVAVVLALEGYGLMALVFQQLGAYFVQLVYLAIAGRWIPGLPNRRGSVGSMLRYGLNTLGGSLTNYAGGNTDRLALGFTVGAEELGVYGRMQQLYMLPVQQLFSPLTRVAVPTLSKLQGDLPQLSVVIADIHRVLAIIASFTVGIMTAFAPDIIAIALGPEWRSGTSILVVLSFGALFQAFGYTYYWVFLSTGRMDVQFKMGLITRFIGIIAILACAHFGTLAVAGAVSGMLVLNWLVYGTVGMRLVGIAGHAALRGIGPSLLLYVVSCSAVFVIRNSLDSVKGTVAAILAYIAPYVLFLVFRPDFRTTLCAALGIRTTTRKSEVSD